MASRPFATQRLTRSSSIQTLFSSEPSFETWLDLTDTPSVLRGLPDGSRDQDHCRGLA